MALPVRGGATQRGRAGRIGGRERVGRPPEHCLRDQIDGCRRQVPLHVPGHAQDGRALVARRRQRRQAVEGAVPAKFDHQGITHRHLALGAAFADDMQPPAAASMEKVCRLRVGGLGRAQRRVVEEVHHPTAALVVLALSRRGLRPGLDRLEHNLPERRVEIALEAPGARSICRAPSPQRERIQDGMVPGSRMERSTVRMSRCPQKAIVMSSSFWMISSVFVTPASPIAPSP